MRAILSFACAVAICAVLGCGGGEEAKKDGDGAAKKAGTGEKDAAKGGMDPSSKKDGSAKTDSGGTAASPIAGDSNVINLNADNTAITFTGVKDDGEHNGGFKAVFGKIELSDDGPAFIDVTLETNSLYSDDKKLTDDLLGSKFFDVISYPKASLSSTKIELGTGDTTHTLTADLTLRGKTNPVTIPLQIDRSDGAFKLTGSFEIRGKDYGFADDSAIVHDEVEIQLIVDTSRK